MQTDSNAAAYIERRFPAAPGIDLYVRDYPPAVPSGLLPLVCLHGYWRTCRDFDALAESLAPTRRVVTPDMRGRGRSDRSTDISDYELDKLVDDVARLLPWLGIEKAVFLGTVLGAHIIMRLVARHPSLVAGVIFNDSAPETDSKAAARAASFSGADALSFDAALTRIRAQNEASFTRYGDDEFVRMTHRAYHPRPDGLYVRDFDQATNQVIPKIKADHPTFWPEFTQIHVPFAVLRGENSDHLSEVMLSRMIEAKPDAEVYTIPGCGHPPMLWEPESIAAVIAFLLNFGSS